MGKHNPIDIQIRWKCSHCGHAYDHALNVCMPGHGSDPKVIGSGSLICEHCGQMGPMQIGCAVILGMSVMAGSDGALHIPRLPGHGEEKNVWATRVRQPSRN
jgi:hypothetical protein